MDDQSVVLAYSGGLDTSFCIKYLTEEKGLTVHAVTVNTGGFSKAELAEMEERALYLGAASFVAIDAIPTYYQRFVRYLIYGNVLRNNTYPLSVSAERVVQALEVVTYARKLGTRKIAHGSTGAGNDQIRFDLVFQVMLPDVEIITPIRDHSFSRQQEVDYLEKHGYSWDKKKAAYSINKGLWGTSVGGAETLTSHTPLPDAAYPTEVTQQASQTITLQFERGELMGIDDRVFSKPWEAIKELEKIAAPYGIGRDIHVGDTITGIKGRVGFEAAAPMIIIKAHHLLEKHVLSKWQQYWKEQLGNWYGMFIHEGQYLEPVMRNIEQFLEQTQANVTGAATVRLKPHHFTLQGITSPHDLMTKDFGQYGESNTAWTADDVKGFIKLTAVPAKIFYHVNKADQ